MSLLQPRARVCLLRMSALGDVLFALETLASLKRERPDIEVDFLVDDRHAAFLDGHPQLARVLAYPRRRPWRVPGFLWSLRRTRYDAVLDLHGIMKSAVNVAFFRAQHKVGFAPPGSGEGAQRFYKKAVELPDPLPHRAERGYFLLRALGLRGEPAPPELPQPRVPPSFWHQDGSPRVVLHPGTSAFAAFKRWPAERFAALGRRLLEEGIAVAVSYGPGEEELALAVVRKAPGVRALDGGALGLQGLGAVFGQADLLVAADTGPLHLAAAAGTRVVALFGPKEPRWYGPRGAGHQLLYRDVVCRPCTLRTCPAPLCILGVGVEAVFASVREGLSA